MDLTKSYNNDVEQFTTYMKHPFGGSPSAVEDEHRYLSVIDSGYKVGKAIKDFGRKVKDGDLLPHTYYKRQTQRGTASGDYSNVYFNGDRRYHTNGRVYDPWSVTQEEIDMAWSKCPLDARYQVQRAAAAIYTRGWDALTFASELNSLIRMFKGIRKRVIQKIRNGQFTDLWMEGRYGWRTFYYDIIDFNDAVRRLGKKSRKRFSQNVGESYSTEWQDTTTVEWSSVDYDIVTRYVADYSVRGSVTADINPPNFRFNPITTTWELITFSFVIDWIVNVGQWLNALSFQTVADRYECSEGTRLVLTKTRVVENIQPNPAWDQVDISLNTACTLTVVERNPSTITNSPQFSVNIDSLKILDLWAIFEQMTRRRR